LAGIFHDGSFEDEELKRAGNKRMKKINYLNWHIK